MNMVNLSVIELDKQELIIFERERPCEKSIL